MLHKKDIHENQEENNQQYTLAQKYSIIMEKEVYMYLVENSENPQRKGNDLIGINLKLMCDF